jgi:hypothetical protein
VVGYTGSAGYNGSFGFTGSTGFVGSVGFVGSIGYIGTVGYTGSVGSTTIPRISSVASIASPLAWNSDVFDMYAAQTQSGNLTLNADTGTPSDGQRMVFRFKDNGTARTITFTTGSIRTFRAIGVTLPTSTVANKTLYVTCLFNFLDQRWDVISVSQEI